MSLTRITNKVHPHRRHRASSVAFSLLELLLALALSGGCILMIGGAIHTYYDALNRGRTRNEESQLARALLNRIADDLRATVQYLEPEEAALQDLAANAMQSAAGGALAGLDAEDLEGLEGLEDLEGLDELGGMGDSGDDVSDPSGQTSTDEAPAGETTTVLSVGELPGIYGNQFELQLDVTRAPRPHELFPSIQTATANQTLATGAMTVTYYVEPVAGASTLAAGPAELQDPSQLGGLVRRELNTVMSRWTTAPPRGEPLPGERVEYLAPEVVALEFQYFDGTQWLASWDSQSQQTLPLAVEIMLTLRTKLDPSDRRYLARAPGAEEPATTYRLLVAMPTVHRNDAVSQDSSLDDTIDAF